MNSKRIVSIILAMVLLLSLVSSPLFFAARAERVLPDRIESIGEGVRWRSTDEGLEDASLMRTFSLISELNVAYLTCDQTYLTPGKAATWTAMAEGGSGGYEYEFVLFWQEPDDPSTYYTSVEGAEQAFSISNAFTFTITKTGTYIVVLSIKDSAGEILEYESEKYPAPQTDALVKKVKEVAALCNASASGSYGKALFMHDWLLNNAYYSYDGPYPHEAQGILLYGSGVCESYALAYQMLLAEVGVSSIYVTGYANEPHAWNLVSMGGAWYHVDTTWDDTGASSHGYFGLTDALMRRDHSWTDKFPACTATQYNYVLRSAALSFTTQREMEALIQAQFDKRVGKFSLFYMGEEPSFNMADAYNAWMGTSSGGYTTLSLSYSNYSATFTVGYDGQPAATDPPVPTETPALKGDATNDGAVNILDLVSIIDYIVSNTSPASPTNADADGVAGITMGDLVWLINKLTGA